LFVRHYICQMRTLPFRVFLIVTIGILACYSFVGAEDQDGPLYQVRAGDTLYSISQQFGGSVESLQKLNGIENPSLLSIGQILLLPGYVGVSGLVDTYLIRPGDSAVSLQFTLNNSFVNLIKLNRIVNPNTLYIGQPLIYTIPDNSETVVEGSFSVVGQKDTLLDMAINADCSPYELMLLNGWSDVSLLVPGELFYLPDTQSINPIPDPFMDVIISDEHPNQGYPVKISIVTESQTSVDGQFGNITLDFVPIGELQVSLFGVNAMSDPGIYPLFVTSERNDGQRITMEMRLPVADAQYQSQRIVLAPDKAKLLEDESVRAAEDEIISNSVSVFTNYQLWDDVFIPPISMDYITTRFGMRRSYNGSEYQTFHGGVDFGALEGTPIYSPASGVVVMSKNLDIRGNTTIIDHGIGVYTGYWHQKESKVSVGEKLRSGELIGYVGNTGLSTGPHLHWEVWVNGVQVDPLEWIKQGIH